MNQRETDFPPFFSFRAVVFFLVSLICLSPSLLFASEMSLGGYSLGLTLDEVKELDGTATFTEIFPVPEGGAIGIRGASRGMALFFTPVKRGAILFRVEKETVFEERPDLKSLMDDLIGRYGVPAQAGRDMVYHHACWGACPGIGAKILFRLKTFFPVKVDHRMTVTLVDTKMELENKDIYRKENKYLMK